MAVDPRSGPIYRPAQPSDPPPPDYPYDGNPPPIQEPHDPGFRQPALRNPDGSDIGPLYATPEGDRWLQENVTDRGYVIDWGTREYFDPETGEVKGIVPTSVPRII